MSTQLNLGSNLIAQGKANEAVAVMEQVASQWNSPVVHKRYGDAMALAKRLEDALHQYNLALAQQKNYVPALNEKGMVLIKIYQKNLEMDEAPRQQALDAWRASLAIRSDQPRIQAALTKWENKQLFGQ